MKMEQSVPKHWHIKFRGRGITYKKAYNIQNKAKVCNQELFTYLFIGDNYNVTLFSSYRHCAESFVEKMKYIYSNTSKFGSRSM